MTKDEWLKDQEFWNQSADEFNDWATITRRDNILLWTTVTLGAVVFGIAMLAVGITLGQHL